MKPTRIRKHRIEAGLTQLHLAKAADVPLNTVRRAEDHLVIRLDHALRISDALKAEPATLFPATGPDIDWIKQSGGERDPNAADEARETMARAGIDLDRSLWTIRLRMRSGISRSYPVSSLEIDRLSTCLDNEEERNTFFVFDTDTHVVVVNPQHVESAGMLGDFGPAPGFRLDEDDQYLSGKVRVRLGRRTRVFYVGQDDPSEADPQSPDYDGHPGQFRDLVHGLEMYPDQMPFVSFEDIDEERFFLRTKSIQLMEIPLGIVSAREHDCLDDQSLNRPHLVSL